MQLISVGLLHIRPIEAIVHARLVEYAFHLLVLISEVGDLLHDVIKVFA